MFRAAARDAAAVKTAGQKKEGGANRDEERGERTERERGSQPRAFDAVGCVIVARQCLRACTVCERLIRFARCVIYWCGDRLTPSASVA